ncbi:MAG: Metallophosphoesterase [uncultured bacterium]|nr:MAG: Metallophosphoesterase [uncultured bacterium]
MLKKSFLFLFTLLTFLALYHMGAFDAIPDFPPVQELFIKSEKNVFFCDSKFSFAVTGDMRWSHEPQVAIHKDIASRSPLFVINLGDVVRWAKTSLYDSYICHLKPFLKDQVRYFHTPGKHSHEHEIYRFVPEVFSSYFGRSFYYIDVNDDWRFIVLDSSSLALPDKQLEWLENIVMDAQRNKREVAILSHCPPHFLEKGITHSLDGASSAKLIEYFKQFSVAAYFAAHIHTNTAFMCNKTPVYITALNHSTWQTEPAGYYFVEVSERKLKVISVQIEKGGQIKEKQFEIKSS